MNFLKNKLLFTNSFKIKLNLKHFTDNYSKSKLNGEKVKFKFVYMRDKKEVDVEAAEGEHVLDVSRRYDIGLEGA